MNNVKNGDYNHVGEIRRVRSERRYKGTVFIYINTTKMNRFNIGKWINNNTSILRNVEIKKKQRNRKIIMCG